MNNQIFECEKCKEGTILPVFKKPKLVERIAKNISFKEPEPEQTIFVEKRKS